MRDFHAAAKLTTASAFGEWVFINLKGSYRLRLPDHEQISLESSRLEWGKLDHEEIEEIKKNIRNELIGQPSDYKVAFVDSDGGIFEAPSLLIGGLPIRGRPDLVLENRTKDHVIIVERKTTRAGKYVSTDDTAVGSWVNIECQLWCYSYLTPWAQRERVSLVGEIWRRRDGVLSRTIEPLVWQKDDFEHESRCRKLFRAYSGEVERALIG